MEPIAYFNQIASKYDPWYSTPIGSYVDAIEKEQVFSLMKEQKGVILDLGCGTGNYTLALNRLEIKAIGLDKSMEMLKIAIQKMSAPFVLGDASVLPFKNQSLDSILSITLFEFLTYPEKTLSEIYRVLRPKGEIIIGTMNTFSAWFLFKRLKSIFKETAYRYARFYTINQLKILFKQAGFTNLTTRGVIYFPAFIPCFLIPVVKKLERKWAASPLRHLAAFVLIRGERP